MAEFAVKNAGAGENVSCIFEGREITNVQMDRAAGEFGNAHRKPGVSKGDRVIMQMPNCPEVLQAFQAVRKIGAVALPINYPIGQEEINYIYRDSDVRTVITSPEYLAKVKTAQSQFTEVKNIVMVSDKEQEIDLNFQKLVDKNSDDPDIVLTDDEDVAAMIHTSGTTGAVNKEAP